MNSLQKYENDQTALVQAATYDQIIEHVALIQKVYQGLMQKDQHYGVIHGTGNKPTLLKPGAEKLSFAFQLAPTFRVDRREIRGDHVEYEVICTLTHRPTGQLVGEGVGICSTMEKKYRYRNEDTGEKIPNDYKDNKASYKAQGFRAVKYDDGSWHWLQQVENPDIADTYNTVIKMAKKRAFVDAILTCTAASDIFTQDVEEMIEKPEPQTEPEKKGASNQKKKPAKKLKEEPQEIDYDAKIKSTHGWLTDKLKEGPEAVIAAQVKAAQLVVDWPDEPRNRALDMIGAFDPEETVDTETGEVFEEPEFFQEPAQ